MAVGEDVYCTLVMTDSYLPGAAVLAHSLRDAGTTHKLACLVTTDSLSYTTLTELRTLYNYVIPVERIGNSSPANLYLMNRPDLLYAFTKINLWQLEQFRKVVYVDADVVALRAPDELFALEDNFAAAPDVGWPDIFNTGVMALTPHMGDYNALRGLAEAGDSFDGADQGLLNQYYEHRPWKRLSFTYNCTPSASYQYEPAYRYFKREISMVHFIGSEKPWQQDRGGKKGGTGVYRELLSRWWAVWDRQLHVSTQEYVNTGRREPAAKETVKKGDEPEYSATGYPLDYQPTQDAAIPKATTAAEKHPHQADIDAMTTQQPRQRKFSDPYLNWDATRAAPPSSGKPEAANFPSHIYEFSSDTQQFRPPAAYPEPPRDMWYQVPVEKRGQPLPKIFPWEEREAQAQPTRVWVGEEEKEKELEAFGAADEFTVMADDDKDMVEPQTPVIKIDGAPWAAGGLGGVNNMKNAWDEVSGIDDYVRALTRFQKTRGNVQILSPSHHPDDAITASQPSSDAHHSSSRGFGDQSVFSPTTDSSQMPEAAMPGSEDLIERVRERRESLLLTDFPSAVERPSLPVTPAPRRRPTFWGADHEEGEDLGLPAADGVPGQEEWDPDHQLEELRRHSLIGPSDLKLPQREMPKRGRVASAVEVIPEHPPDLNPPQAVQSSTPSVSFSTPDFQPSNSAAPTGSIGSVFETLSQSRVGSTPALAVEEGPFSPLQMDRGEARSS
ncbi:hypothetical protein LTR62_007283 [Meristemomyces frigidus]|uniref:glycogenin glucosyltransferase n=1 Tax=Meristemomyces frigidus TaxID=1508187 RepID=A0AAN7YMF8_9PEZI|nr:hypothetical protein LTR62_007283 [Meristemomyces frigidus]